MLRGVRRDRARACSARRSRSPAWPATSRRPCSARRASRQARPRTPTAPAAFCWSTTGEQLQRSPIRVCCRPSPGSSPTRQPTYALEGSAFVTGAAVQWLRDGLGHHLGRRRDRGTGRVGPRQRRRVSGAGVRRPRRAALGHVRARSADRPDARHARGPTSSAPRSRASLFSRAIWSTRWHTAGQPIARAEGRRWRDGQRLSDAVSSRHARRAGRGGRGPGDDCAGCRVPGGSGRRPVDRPGRAASALALRASASSRA